MSQLAVYFGMTTVSSDILLYKQYMNGEQWQFAQRHYVCMGNVLPAENGARLHMAVA